MNIAHVLYAKCWGGGEQYVYNLCKEEAARGNKNVVVLDSAYPFIAEKFKDVAMVKPLALHGIKRFFQWKAYLSIIDQHKIDILNCHSGTMASICALLKIFRPNVKLVLYKHNLSLRKKDLYHRWLNQKTDAVICVSKAVYAAQTCGLSQSAARKYHLIYNGIDVDSFPMRKNYLPSTPVKIGYAGRMVEDKGILTLLQAVEMLKNKYHFACELYLTGDGQADFIQKCADWAAIHGLQEIYHYQRVTKNMAEFYRGLDVFVLPSIVREAFGLVLCEAMSCGVPVISTNSGAQGEIIVHDTCGELVPPRDAAAIARQIIALATQPDKYRAISQAGRNRVENLFTVKGMVTHLNDVFEKLRAQPTPR